MGRRMVFTRPTQVRFMVTYPLRENTSYFYLIYIQKEPQRRSKKELHLLIDVHVIYLFIFSCGHLLKQCT